MFPKPLRNIYDKPPSDMMAVIAVYPHIAKQVVEHWGTVKLKEYFDMLLRDTRNGTRKGFAEGVAESLFGLAAMNTEYLEFIGIIDTEPAELDVRSWTIPKNW